MNVMNEFADNVLEASVIKTVRNLKKKKTPQDDSNEDQSRLDSTSQNGKKTPSRFSIALETEPNANAINTPGSLSTTHKKGRKTKGTANSTSGSVTDQAFVSPPNQEEKGDVFKRLAMSKAQSGLTKDTKKMPKKEVEVNFFDNHYARPIGELIDSLITKSKPIRSLMETKGLSVGFVNKNIVNDVHFGICFKMMLAQLLRDGEINAEFKNMTKPTYAKLEKFVIDKIEYKLRLESLDAAIQDHYKEVEIINKNRIAELNSKLPV